MFFVVIIFVLVVIMGVLILFVFFGVGKGIKWLFNINMGLSFFLLVFFLIFGVIFFSLKIMFVGIWDYLLVLSGISFIVWLDDGIEKGVVFVGW